MALLVDRSEMLRARQTASTPLRPCLPNLQCSHKGTGAVASGYLDHAKADRSQTQGLPHVYRLPRRLRCGAQPQSSTRSVGREQGSVRHRLGRTRHRSSPDRRSTQASRPGHQAVARRPFGAADSLAEVQKYRALPVTGPISVQRSKSKPGPSRERLDEAEPAVRQFEQEAEAELAALQEREEAIRQERDAIEQRHEAKATKLDAQLARSRDQFERVMRTWRKPIACWKPKCRRSPPRRIAPASRRSKLRLQTGPIPS